MELTNFSDVMQQSKEVLDKCFKKYSVSQVFLSFNGGKDCTVLLDLTLSYLQTILPNKNDVKLLKFFYIRQDNPFPELESFIRKVESIYVLNMIIVHGDMKKALEKILQDDTNLKACLMGSRKTDPFSENLEYFQITDSGWPQIMRVSPLLNWSYHQIWSYLIQKNVAYCSLYDNGYTSIGNTDNTIPNPALKEIQNGCVVYKPAYLLKDGSLERSGRNKKKINGTTKIHKL